MVSNIFRFKNIDIILKILIFGLVFLTTDNYVYCSNFSLNYPNFDRAEHLNIAGNSTISTHALQVTQDTNHDMRNQSGRVVYHEKFKLWKKQRVASFNSTFVLNIAHDGNDHGVGEGMAFGGEGMAFILAADDLVPANSDGQWLGIVNATMNGTSQKSIVAIEFDTKKSFPEDIDDNHVGLNINSVFSVNQSSLNSLNINISSGKDTTAMILYDGSAGMLNVFVYEGDKVGSVLTKPIISMPVNLSQHLPNDVYVGFCASTGLGVDFNCVKAWFFEGTDIDPGTGLWVWIMVAGLISSVLVCSLAGWYLYWRIKQTRVKQSDSENTIQYLETGLGPKKMKLKDLKAATGNFNAKNELGRGGFGVVYMGVLDGIEVAVKRMIKTPQGKQNMIAEVTTIGSIHHKNLVKLIGWCHERKELVLIYEYMPNRSLDYYIHINDENRHENKPMLLSWERRHSIICGVAQVVDYLHNECSKRVLHRDIKASNIMLDAEFNACLGDFGLARLFKPSENTHHSTKEIAGTPGYMAPEILLTGRATSETDVYAFGVLILVVATGKKPAFQTEGCEYRNNIIDWVWELHSLDMIVEATDPKMDGNFEKEDAECMLRLGLACCHPNPHMRPSMRIALQVLMGEVLPPFVPHDKPTFMWPATSPSLPQDDIGGMLSFSGISAR